MFDWMLVKVLRQESKRHGARKKLRRRTASRQLLRADGVMHDGAGHTPAGHGNVLTYPMNCVCVCVHVHIVAKYLNRWNWFLTQVTDTLMLRNGAWIS